MKNIFKNMVPYWKTVVLIFALLVVQAFCDLSLPQYTSDIIDTGIQNQRIFCRKKSKRTNTGWRSCL